MDIGDSQENDIHYKLHNGMIPQIIDMSIVQSSSENVSENVKFLQIIDLFKDLLIIFLSQFWKCFCTGLHVVKDITKIIDFVKELLIIFLSQFWKISKKKFERYSQNHHFIQSCLCRNYIPQIIDLFKDLLRMFLYWPVCC